MKGIVDDIMEDVDDILGLRDELGAIKKPIYIVTWKWPQVKGQGSPVQTIKQVLPTPYLVDFAHSRRAQEGGNWKAGDLLLKDISKKSYPNETDIDCSVTDKVTEKWYMIDGYLYEVESVVSDYVSWDVKIKKTIKKRL